MPSAPTVVTRRSVVAAVLALLVATTLVGTADANHRQPFDGSLHDYGDKVDYRLVFPVGGSNYYFDSFWACRGSPCGYHHAQDLMASKMVPVRAAAAGTVRWVNWSSSPSDLNPDRCCTMVIEHDDDWQTWYIHLNNDTPGTDDGKGWGIAPGLVPGSRVSAGQLIGWVGDSGNAENTGSHLHFELYDPEGVIVNPFNALKTAEAGGLQLPCAGKTPNVWDKNGDGVIIGTDGDDIISGSPFDDVIVAKGGDDLVCAFGGDDRIDTGEGNDKIRAGPGIDYIGAGAGNDLIFPGAGRDVVFGGDGDDRIYLSRGGERIDGADGIDTVLFRLSGEGLVIDLAAGTAGKDRLKNVENVIGSRFGDLIIGTGERNVLRGAGGDDTIRGGGGNDSVFGGGASDELSGGSGDDILRGGSGEDAADGGDGTDLCQAETATACEI